MMVPWIGELTRGLYPYETGLLLLGVVLFAVTLVVFIGFAIAGRPLPPLVAFFLVSILMIGYPSVKSVTIKGDEFTLTKEVDDLNRDPTNIQLRQNIAARVGTLEPRLKDDAPAQATFAEARYALGDEGGAQSNLQQALQRDPNQPVALALVRRMELVKTVNNLTATVSKHPADETAKAALADSVKKLTVAGVSNPSTLTTVAQAHAVLGNRQQAIIEANKALAVDPRSVAARAVLQDR